jgi:hypothetical protein
MFLLSHLFYPWGFIVQIFALVHFFRRRPEGYWIWIIFFGGALGAAIYIIAEVIPDAPLLKTAFAGYSRDSRIQQVQALILDNPSIANYEELGELYYDQHDYAPAREAFDNAIARRADALRTFYLRGRSEEELGDFPAAVADLEKVVRSDPRFDSYHAAAALARAYAAVGRGEEAATMYASAIAQSSTPDMLYNYALFLKSQNRVPEALEILRQLREKKKTMPRYMERIDRPWFRKGKALEKQLVTG